MLGQSQSRGVLSMKLASEQKQGRQQVIQRETPAHLDSVRLLFIQAKLFITIQGLQRQTLFSSLGHIQETINNKTALGFDCEIHSLYFTQSLTVA